MGTNALERGTHSVCGLTLQSVKLKQSSGKLSGAATISVAITYKARPHSQCGKAEGGPAVELWREDVCGGKAEVLVAFARVQRRDSRPDQARELT